MTLCSDLAIPTVAKISNKLKLPGISLRTSLLSTNKSKMKMVFLENNINTPEFKIIKNINQYRQFESENKLPLVLKPTDSSGQKGIFLINNNLNLNEKIDLIKKISSDQKVIVEKFYKGYEINVVAIVERKHIKFLSISHRKTSSKKNFGIATHHVYPSKLNHNDLLKVKKLCKKAIKAIEIEDGVVYPQILMTNKNVFHLIEIASRIPGGFMREMAHMVSGIDPIEFLIRKMIGENNVFKKIKRKKRYKSVYIKFFTKLDFKNKKFITNINGLEKARKQDGIYKIFFKKTKKIPTLKLSKDRFGAILAYGENLGDAIKKYKKALNKIEFILK